MSDRKLSDTHFELGMMEYKPIRGLIQVSLRRNILRYNAPRSSGMDRDIGYTIQNQKFYVRMRYDRTAKTLPQNHWANRGSTPPVFLLLSFSQSRYYPSRCFNHTFFTGPGDITKCFTVAEAWKYGVTRITHGSSTPRGSHNLPSFVT